MEKDITYFAKTNFRGKEHVFGIKEDDRRRHTYVIGKTGMGKTNLLENMIISDIQAGRGVAVIDPHGDLAEAVLNFVPASRINDVVYFNPADVDYPIAFNVMEQVDSKYRHLVASGLIGVFKKIWADSWGPRLEYLLRNVILALLEYPGSTLLGVPRMFIDKEYRKKVVNKVTDPVVKAFWLNEFTKYSQQFTVDAISPIQNKVGQFLSSSLVRNIISQTQSTINMRDIMDNKKILIVNLAKGKIGEDYSALLGAMLITKIQLAAMGRADIPEEERKDFYLYVDEFQNFATESFAGILSEARKYRLDLIIAHQYIGQLEEEVRDAIFGNVGTLISFRVGAADAEWLEKEFEPVFMMNDLVNLAKYDIYLKLMINGVTGDAFSATTLPPFEIAAQSNVDKIIKVSRERYSNKREIVEDKISRWSGMDEKNEEVVNGKKENANQEEAPRNNKEVVDNRKTWDAVCEVCKERVKVPFEPDPKRAIYCKNCLVEVRKKITETVKETKKEISTIEAGTEIKPVIGSTIVEKQQQVEIKEVQKIENSIVSETVKEEKIIEKEENIKDEKVSIDNANVKVKQIIEETKVVDHAIVKSIKKTENNTKEDVMKNDTATLVDVRDDGKKIVNSQININNNLEDKMIKSDLAKGRDMEIKEGEIVRFDE